MSKLLNFLFLLTAFTILVDVPFQLILKSANTFVVEKGDFESDDEDSEKKENEEKGDSKKEKEEKTEKEDKEEKYQSDKNTFKSYDFLLKSTLSSTQYTLFISDLNYKSRCRELESPPPEV
jgi:hypothetical protein